MSGNERQQAFDRLCREAARCRRCPRMSRRKAVLGPLNGTLRPKVLFIGEAPGRQGAEITRKPFCGDVSGRKFEMLLASAGLSRDDAFITNAALCCPADDRRNNTPTAAEVRNCRPFLQRLIDLLEPPVVATVGAVALKAIEPLTGSAREGILAPASRGLKLAEVAGTVIRGARFLLVPLYHTSPRVLNTTRSFAQQQADFLKLREAI
ncbi:MAG TPA: uracil-DNA glycosylase [Phycisphaerae bacterium]|nr:uracil-DNA glycosylase [Phycisphaerae bacterium]